MCSQQIHWHDRNSGTQGSNHLDPSVLKKAANRSVAEAGVTRTAFSHTFRHSVATHPLERRQDIRTIQEVLGHNDVTITMIYTHVLDRGPFRVRSSADLVWQCEQVVHGRRKCCEGGSTNCPIKSSTNL